MPVTGGLVAGSVLAPIAGGLIGYALSEPEREAAKQAQANALASIGGVGVPSVDSQKVSLGNYGLAGSLSPAMEQAVSQGPSAMEKISLDPQVRQAQMQALAQMGALSQGGLGAQDMAALAQIQAQTERDAQARNASVLQNMQMRGMGGSGAELAAQLANSQGAAERARQQGLDVAGQAQARALQALSQYGGMAGQLRGQSFGEQAQVANAADQIARFNAMNQQQVNAANTMAQNQAQMTNLQNAQRIADVNRQTANQQQMYNQGLIQQNYQNQMGKAQAAANAWTGQRQFNQQQAANTQQALSGAGQGLGTSLGGVASASMKSGASEEE